jgi:hypothetical protein
VRNKIAQLLAAFFAADYPDGWPDAMRQDLWMSSVNAEKLQQKKSKHLLNLASTSLVFNLVTSSRPSVTSLPQTFLTQATQDVSQSVGIQTGLLQTNATAHNAISDYRIGTLDASMNSRVSAVLRRRYDLNDPTDDQGAEFAALAEAGLLTGQREVSVPTTAKFGFLVSEKAE